MQPRFQLVRSHPSNLLRLAQPKMPSKSRITFRNEISFVLCKHKPVRLTLHGQLGMYRVVLRVWLRGFLRMLRWSINSFWWSPLLLPVISKPRNHGEYLSTCHTSVAVSLTYVNANCKRILGPECPHDQKPPLALVTIWLEPALTRTHELS